MKQDNKKRPARPTKSEREIFFITDFMNAAFPFVVIGICLAIISANHHKQEGKEDAKNYMVEGMCLGMCLGVVFSDSLGIGLGLGASLGMLIGETAGMFFKKK